MSLAQDYPKPTASTGSQSSKKHDRKKKHKMSEVKRALKTEQKLEQTSLLSKNTYTITATKSLDLAIEKCRNKVEKIAAECRQNNIRFRDRKFDLFGDSYSCLYSAKHPHYNSWSNEYTRSLRVGEIFEKPEFYIDGPRATDIKQGALGDCWFLSALATIANIDGLIDRICVARDEVVGVYGFIFFKDGDWISTVIDDRLPLGHDTKDGKKELYFANPSQPGETWVPLIEKAYSKVHGDYESISGGWPGEGIEDLTGGVHTQIISADILDREQFWQDEMLKVNTDRLMGLAHMLPYETNDNDDSDHSLIDSHAYSVIKVAEVDDKRFVQVRNPWGIAKGEWSGPWSDGSAEWTPYWLEKLEHKFGGDGIFWMTYKDFLDNYQYIDRVRLFNADWSMATKWINYNVVPESHGRFELVVTEPEQPTVIVVNQMDSRYKIENPYFYTVSFYVYVKGMESNTADYIYRSRTSENDQRSINIEVVLQPGTYVIVPRIRRFWKKPDEESDDSYTKLKEEEALSFQEKGGLGELKSDDTPKSKTEENTEENKKWELMVGIRIYSKDKSFQITAIQPEKTATDAKKINDPEDIEKSAANEKVDEDKKKDGEVTDDKTKNDDAKGDDANNNDGDAKDGESKDGETKDKDKEEVNNKEVKEGKPRKLFK